MAGSNLTSREASEVLGREGVTLVRRNLLYMIDPADEEPNPAYFNEALLAGALVSPAANALLRVLGLDPPPVPSVDAATRAISNSGSFVVMYNLHLPLSSQFAAAQQAALDMQADLRPDLAVRREHRATWPTLLRVLDARDNGISFARIGEEFHKDREWARLQLDRAETLSAILTGADRETWRGNRLARHVRGYSRAHG